MTVQIRQAGQQDRVPFVAGLGLHIDLDRRNTTIFNGQANIVRPSANQPCLFAPKRHRTSHLDIAMRSQLMYIHY